MICGPTFHVHSATEFTLVGDIAGGMLKQDMNLTRMYYDALLYGILNKFQHNYY